MIYPDLQTIALIEMSLTCAALIILIIQKMASRNISGIVRLPLWFILGNLFYWPLGMTLELPLAAYVRGVTGDLSIVSLLLLWTSLLPANKRSPIAFKVSVVLVAIAFYPLALGVGMVDPYAWGYGSVGLFLSIAFLAVVSGILGWTKGVWIFSLAIIAWTLHWHESTNLWDYVFDPFLVIWAVCAICSSLYRKRREKAQSGYLFRAG